MQDRNEEGKGGGGEGVHVGDRREKMRSHSRYSSSSITTPPPPPHRSASGPSSWPLMQGCCSWLSGLSTLELKLTSQVAVRGCFTPFRSSLGPRHPAASRNRSISGSLAPHTQHSSPMGAQPAAVWAKGVRKRGERGKGLKIGSGRGRLTSTTRPGLEGDSRPTA